MDPIGARMLIPLVAPMSLLLGYGWATAWRWRARQGQPAGPAAPEAAERVTPVRAFALLTAGLAVTGVVVLTVVNAQTSATGARGPARGLTPRWRQLSERCRPVRDWRRTWRASCG